MARRAFFSEGRGLRARTVRPDEWQGIALPPVPFREAGGQKDETSALALCRHYGRAEPAPPRGAKRNVGGPTGENPETTRRAIFPEGRGLRVRKYGPDRNRDMSSRLTGRRRARGQNAATLWFA
jgi:hypothetical protein